MSEVNAFICENEVDKMISEAEARGYSKAIEEAAAVCRKQTQGLEAEEGEWNAGWTSCAETCLDAILALKSEDKP
jgi:hypothetical protein